MSDRCTVNITIKKHDAGIVKAIFGEPDEVDLENAYSVTLTFYDTNYGGITEIEQLRKANIKFLAFSGMGEEYDPHLFAVSGTKLVVCPAGRDGAPVVHANDSCLCLEDMISVREYYTAKSEIEASWRALNLRHINSGRSKKKEKGK